jgi:ubiquinone/menaquinone biosynthesis C-methylase UbiE
MLGKFFEENKKICKRLAGLLPQAKVDIYDLYEEKVVEHMNLGSNMVIVDVGAGRTCAFARRRDPSSNNVIVAVDISEEELRHNRDVDEKMVADIIQGLPFEEGEVDLVVSKSLLEHLNDVSRFFANSNRALKKGGKVICVFACRYAPFAVINRMLPRRVARKLLRLFHPEHEETCGFPAYYRQCYHSAILSLLQENGLELVEARLCYYQSEYFAFFLPLFLISALYEVAVKAVGAKDLSAYMLVVAEKR